MKRIAPVFVLGMMTVLTSAAHATTLTVTSGWIHVLSDSGFEPGGVLFGDAWSLHGFSGHSCCAFGPESETFGLDATLTLNGVVLGTPCCDDNSLFTIVRGPSPLEPGCDLLDCPPWEAVFFMRAQLFLGEAIDVVGQGIVSRQLFATQGDPSVYQLTYNFRPVPEPPTLLLLIAALGALFGARFLHDRWHRRGWTP
jgi:hypothetical protein